MQAPPVISGSLTLTGSITSTGPITGSGFFTAGTITAQTLVVQTVTSSVSSITGSTKFGSIIGNTHQFTGSVLITGSAPALQISSSNYALSLVGGGATRYAGTISNTGGNLDFGIEGSAGNQLFTGAGPYEGGIGTSIARNFHLVSNSTVRMTISASGNVGIGTSSPTERLDVIGGAVAAGNGTIRTGITYSTLGLIGTFTNHNLGIITNGDTKMFISASGNVGIGTSSPSFKLSVLVDGGGLEDGIRLGVGSNGDGIKIVQRYLSDRTVALLGQSNYGSATDSGALRLFDVGGTETVRLSGKSGIASYITSGNVGIGTASPLTLLDLRLAATDGVAGSVLSSYPIASFVVNASGGGQRGLQLGGPTGGISSPVFLKVFGTGQRFAVLNETNVENFTVTSASKVGIGNNNPNNVVDIFGNSTNTVGLLGVRTSGGGTFITGRIVSAETANQTLTIATCSTGGTNERIFLKIQVVNVSAVSNYGNVHVGYALWIGSGGSSVTTMTLDTGNSNISNTNVGTLSWSGNNLQYTTNRGGNYEMNHITIWACARDTGVVS
jgi:hypothetical protein